MTNRTRIVIWNAGMLFLLAAGPLVFGETHREVLSGDCQHDAPDCLYIVVRGNPILSGPSPDFAEALVLLGFGIGLTAFAAFGLRPPDSR
jgi:hypothetical protein